ncbi:precorrin-6y C5,15-methyltransferase (decarboxylating) subunit CbiE [bacterium]|nr:precorrin-6y C5,15-methyltransferase (decarboxylating) subunit CbiE [bacterium]
MIYLVGMGPGHINHLTREAVEIISNVEHNIAFGRIAETAHQLTRKVTTAHKLEDVVKLLKHKGDTAILASGDACFYGILDFLQSKQVKIARIIPGITSFQYMMNQLQISWQKSTFFSLHGRNQNYHDILASDLAIILTDTRNSPDTISKKLFELGGAGTIYVGFDLSYDTEIILEKQIGEPIPEISSLSTVVIVIERPDAA